MPNPFYGEITTGALSTPTVQLRQLLRPYPQYQDVLIFRDPYGDMPYQSMTLRVQKQYSKGLMLSLGYTLSKTIANTAQSNTWVVGPSDAMYNANYNRSLEANDVPQRLVLSYMYDLPVGRGQRYLSHGLAATVLGGWEFSGISVFQSGRPLLITAPDQTNLYNFSSTNGRANPAAQRGAPKRAEQYHGSTPPRSAVGTGVHDSERFALASRICADHGASIWTGH